VQVIGNSSLILILGDTIFEHLFEEFKAAKNWDVFEEVHPVLRKIKQDYPRIKLGVVSNFDERLVCVTKYPLFTLANSTANLGGSCFFCLI
jgi:hypothetical protein